MKKDKFWLKDMEVKESVSKKSVVSKMIIKNKSLIIIMPERKDKNYYESSSFKKILDAINTNPQLYMIKEKNDRLYIYINKKIKSVIEVDEILSNFE